MCVDLRGKGGGSYECVGLEHGCEIIQCIILKLFVSYIAIVL